MLTHQQAQETLAQCQQWLRDGQYPQANTSLEQIIPIFETAQDWENYAQSIIDRSICLHNSGKRNNLEKLEQTLALCLDKFGRDSPLTLKCYIALGNVCVFMAIYDKAQQYFNHALQQSLKLYGENHRTTANVYAILGTCELWQGKPQQALDKTHKALSIMIDLYGEEHWETATYYHSYGACFLGTGDYHKYYENIQKSFFIKEQHTPKNHADLGITYMAMSMRYLEIADYDTATEYLTKASNVFAHEFYADSDYHAEIYFAHARIADKKGDIDLCILYITRALAIRLTALGENHPKTGHLFSGLGIFFFNKGEFQIASNYLQKGMDIQKKVWGIKHPLTLLAIFQLGAVYFGLKDFQKALTCMGGVLTDYIEVIGKEHKDIGEIANNIGIIYLELGQADNALPYLQDSLNIYLKIYGFEHHNTASVYYSMATYYYTKGDVPNRLNSLQQSLLAYRMEMPENDIFALPQIKSYHGDQDALKSLEDKGLAFGDWFNNTGNFEHLTASQAFYMCSDAMIDHLRNRLKIEGSKLTLAKIHHQTVYGNGLRRMWEAYQLYLNIGQQQYAQQIAYYNQLHGYHVPENPIELGFHFSEKGKAMLLYNSIIEADARINSQIPPELLQQLENLQANLTQLNIHITEDLATPDNTIDANALQEAQEQYFAQKETYDKLIQQLEQEYPDYYQLKYDTKTAKINEIQEALPPKTAMLSFAVGKEFIYMFLLTPHTAHWQEITLPTQFDDLVNKFLLSFQPFGKEDYLIHAHHLYRIFIEPIQDKLNKLQHLIIIPDGILSLIPFEALLTQACEPNTPYQQLPYLIKEVAVSYHFSATLWLHQRKKETAHPSANAANSFLGFAPVYSNFPPPATEQNILVEIDHSALLGYEIDLPQEPKRKQYALEENIVRAVVEGADYVELIHSETEARNVGNLFAASGNKAQLLLHQAATLEAFTAHAPHYKYILVAAHADYDDERPEKSGIIFSPNPTDGKGILYLPDAYNLRLKAELVVLSCCETGLGKINHGEGIVALNRGFLFAGAKNVIYTLFKVPDKESVYLNTELFSRLLQQQPCVYALRHAKLALIEQGLMPLKWAGYVMLGVA